MIMKKVRPAGDGFIRFTDGLGNRRCKRIGLNPKTPAGVRARKREFQRQLMCERIRAEREQGIDPKFMHTSARQGFLAERRAKS